MNRGVASGRSRAAVPRDRVGERAKRERTSDSACAPGVGVEWAALGESGERGTRREHLGAAASRDFIFFCDERMGMNNSSFSSQHRPDIYLVGCQKKASSATVARLGVFFCAHSLLFDRRFP